MKKKSIISAVLIVLFVLCSCFDTPNIGAASAQNDCEESFAHFINCHHEDCEDDHEEIYDCIGHEDCEDDHEEVCDCTGDESCEAGHEEACDCTGDESCKAGHKEACDCTGHEDCEAGHEVCSCECTSDNDNENAVSVLDTKDVETAGSASFIGKIAEYTSLSGTVVLAASCSHQFNGSYTTVKEPTCTTDGTKEGRCTKCGAVVSTASIPALGHNYGSWTVTKAATCTTAGSRKRTCSRCNYVETQAISATGHTFNGSYTTVKEPTCTEPGRKEGRCTKCGAVVSTAEIPAPGHNFGSWTVTKAATCTTAGSQQRTCSRCKYVETQTIKETGHAFNGSYTTVKNPTCTEPGRKEGKCTKCGAVVSTVEIPKTEHNLSSWTTKKEPTCVESGIKEAKCIMCGTTVQQYITSPGHTIKFTTVKKQTCTDEGLEEGRCTKCGALVQTRAIPPLGGTHQFNGSYSTAIEPTCEEDGLRVGNCSKCGVTLTTAPIEKLGHNVSSWKTLREETCTEDGIKEGKCLRCSKTVQEKIPRKNHKFDGSYTVVKEATCEENGLQEGRCTRCGAVVSSAVIEKKGHKYDKWKILQEETCTKDGIIQWECSECHTYSEQIKKATGHTFNGSYTTVKKATCTEEGLREGRCTKCGETVTSIVDPKLPHNYKWIVIKEETCTEDGIREGKCEECSELKTESIRRKDHKFDGSYNPIKDPTCTEKGISEGRCTRCGAIVSTVETPELGHSYDWKIIKEETCTEEGIREEKCSRCSDRKTVTIQPKGHKFDGSYTQVKAPTCTDYGLEEGRCGRCGAVVTTKEIKPLGGPHQFNGSYTVVKERTCTDYGLEEGRCSKCGVVVTTKEIPPLGGSHQFNGSYNTVKEATCTETGLREGRCSRCSAVVSTIVDPIKHTYSKIIAKPEKIALEVNNSIENPIQIYAVCSLCQRNVDVTSEAKFSSSNYNMASVVNGYIKSGTQFGTATITADYDGMKAVVNVEVKPAGGEKLRALRITPKEETLTEFNKWGSEVKVMAIYDDGEVDITDYAEFSSGDKAIAYVDTVDGKKYLKSGIYKQGTTLITASYGGKKDTCSVKVDMNGKVETMPFSIGETTSFTIPENLPVIGGYNVEFSMNFIPVTLSYGENEFRMAVGFENDETVNKRWKDFKKYFEDAKNSRASLKELRDGMSRLGPKKSSFSITDKWDPDLSVYGYIEGIIVDGSLVVTSSSLALIFEGSVNYQEQFFIGPVPVYFEIGAGVKLEHISDIYRLDLEKGKLMLNSQLTITPYFELGAGVGVAKVLTVGGSGKVELEFLVICGSENYLKVTLTGSLKLKAKALFFSAEKEIAKGSWTVYESYPRNKSLMMMANSYGDAEFNMYDANEYKMMSRDYIERPSEWLGNRRLMRAMATGFANKEIKVLGTNIYPDAQPQLVNLQDKQVLVWISDNPKRTSANRTMLVYSVYDKDSGMWSEPVAIDDDGTADFYPQLAQDGNDLYVVWQNCNKTFNEDVTLEEVASSGEIAVSKFDEETGTFGAVVHLTKNDVVDMLPQIAVSNGNVYITWISNNKNDIFGVDGENSIYYCELKGNAWTRPQLLCEGLNAIVSLSTGFIDDSFAVAYALDGDDMLETIDDMEIYVVKPGDKAIRITDNDTMDSSPVFSSFNGTGALYWYNEGNVLYITQLDSEPIRVFSEENPGVKDDFKVIEGSNGETAIIWTNSTEGSSAIYTAIYDHDSATWSDVVKLADVEGEIQSPDGIFDEDGNFSIALSRLTELEDGNEQADLCIIRVVPSYNLTVDGINFDHSEVIPGTQLAIDVELTNNGEIGVEELVVDILDGDEVINSEAIKVSLKPGESKTATVLMNLPDTIAKKTYSIRVSTVEGEEYNTDDNIKQFTIGYTDISVQLERSSEGGIEYVAANVINLSHVPTGATLKVTKGSEDGEVVDTRVIESTDDIVKFEYQFDKKVLCADKESEILYFTVIADEEELYTSDNVKFIVLTNEKSNNETSVYGYISVDMEYPAKSESKIKSGFTVKITGTELSTTTDEKGYFEITGIPEDMKEFTLEISKPSFLKRNVTVNGTGELVVSTEDNPIMLWAGDVVYNGSQDDAINMVDLVQVLKAFNTTEKSEKYVAELDFDQDGAINIREAVIIIKHFNMISKDYENK